MSDEWGVKTGTLYFHLKELKGLIEQDSNKQYKLTNKGKKVCKWFIGEENQPATVTKIDSFSFLVRPFFYTVEQNSSIQIVIAILALIGIIGGAALDTLILGPMLLPRPNTMNFWVNLLINTSIVIGVIGLAFIGSKILGRSHGIGIIPFVLLGNSIAYGLVTIAILTTYVLQIPVITLAFWGWLLISIISQVWFALILSGAMIMGSAIKPERAIIITFALLYLILLVFILYL